MKDALWHNSLTIANAIGQSPHDMHIEATVGVPKPELVDKAAVAATFPYGKVTVEAVEDMDDRSMGSGNAWVEAGDLACPPEDSGGIGQYTDFLKEFEDNPYGEDTKDTRVWAGLDFDPELFDRYAANAAIARMLWNGWIKIGA